MRTRTPVALFASLTLLAACGGSSSEASDAVRPASDLFVAIPVVTPDPDGTSATLAVSTKSKVACRVYWGTTKEATEGSATDPDMASSGPHTNHHAVMTGLKPDTTYYYRVAGTDPAGIKYAADLGTFHTPAARTKPGTNIAGGAKVAGVSSQYSDAYGGANAIDGNAGTEWATAGDGDKAWIKLDLGSVRSLVGIGFRTRSMSDGTAIMKSITVMGDDGKILGPFPLGPGMTIIPFTLKTKTLKISAAKTTGGNTGATEIEVYAKP